MALSPKFLSPRQTSFRGVAYPLIIFTGESNSGGRGQNSDATAAELAVRPETKILNNTTLLYEDLDIGTNNFIGHAGLESFATAEHSIELELANQSASLQWIKDRIYICKTGQGGSIAGWWLNNATTYAKTFSERVAIAMQLLEDAGIPYRPVVYMSLGWNDGQQGTATATYKANVKAIHANIRTVLGATTPIVMTKFESPLTAYANINTAIDEIAAEDSLCFAMSTEGLPGSGAHWSYAGLKGVAAAFRKQLFTKPKTYLAPDGIYRVPPKTNLAAWYDAADRGAFQLYSNAVGEWYDKSGNGRTAAQATSTNRPQRTGTKNGLSTLVFNASPSNWLTLTYSSWAQRPVTFYAVFKNSKTVAAGTLHSAIFAGGSSNLFVGRSGSDDAVLGAGFGTHASVAASTTDWRVLRYSQAGGTGNTAWSLSSGPNSASGSNGPAYSTQSTFQIGAYSGGGFNFGGEIAEILIYSGVTDAATDARVNAYLKTKWAIA
jgi:hypothetical protein